MKHHLLNPQLPMPAPGSTTLPWIDSATACTRCHACSQSCPSFILQPQEIYSPRGRVQLIRLLLEGKIKQTPLVKQAITSCLLCARCSAACAGQVPVAVQITALRQNYEINLLPISLRWLLRSRLYHPRLFNVMVHVLLALQRSRILCLLRPILPAWLRHLSRILPRHLRPMGKPAPGAAQPDLVFLPSLYAQYIDSSVAVKTLQFTQATAPYLLTGLSSGLEYYLYDRKKEAVQSAQQLITRWEEICQGRALPLVTDSPEIAGFIRHYPLLFEPQSPWHARAQALAKQLREATDFTPISPTFSPADTTKIRLDGSSVLYPADLSTQQIYKILQAHLGKNLLECGYSRFPLPAAGVAFVYPKEAAEVVLEYVKDLAHQQVTHVFCLSGWAALELNAALKHYYPAAKAQHWTNI